MKKIISISIIAIIISFSLGSIAGAETTLDGTIDVEVKEWLGVVYPQVNLDNQSVSFEVEITTEEEQTTYLVNDTLVIDLDITKDTNRTTIFPRSIFYNAFLKRSLSFRDLFPLRGLLNRWFPVREYLGTANVYPGLVAKNESDSINLSFSYEIDEETFNSTENMTLIISIMGFLPGDLNGLSEKIPVITKKQITLEVDYIEKI